MVDPQVLIGLFATNVGVIHQQTAGLTHEDSLLQLPFRGNCLNWVLGHILASRTLTMRVLGIDPIWTEEQRIKYQTGSDPVTAENCDSAFQLEAMLADLDESQARIAACLATRTLEDMNAPSDRPDRSMGQRLAGMAWHEGYHVGQTEYLRQLAGKNDRVIG